jgi:hypothetical protein
MLLVVEEVHVSVEQAVLVVEVVEIRREHLAVVLLVQELPEP